MTIHIVKQGETLYSIAREYNVSADVLAENNGVSNPDRLAVGQSLIIVFPETTHTVGYGETLFSIAQKYNVTVESLYKNNLFLKGMPDITEGERLVISYPKEYIGAFQTGGYAYPFINKPLLNTTLPFMSAVMPFTYGFNDNGGLVVPDDSFIISRAKAYGTTPVMHLSTLTENDSFSVALAERLLSDASKWQVLADNILNNMKEKGYGALDVDFEFLGKSNALRYAEFIGFMRRFLNENGYPVMVALAPKTSKNQIGSLYEGHDYALLGEQANAVLLMTYEWGYTYGPPMAVSPIQPLTRVIEYALTEIPANKIFLGVSNYGYDFTLPYVQGLSRAQSLSTVTAFELAANKNAEIIYDEQAQAPYFEYSENGMAHIVWFEDARSLSARLLLVPQFELKGVLYWNLMRPNPQNLVLINTLVDLQKFNLFD